ncbi:hypothetical protein GC173_01090 [bacterium]|nr:hypothetical protein [bacterium]
MKQRDILEVLELSQSVLGQWIRYRQYYLKAVSEEPISPQEDVEFRETTSALAQNVRRLAQKIDEKRFPSRTNEVSSQLKNVISITHMRNMPEMDRKNFYKEWHTSMIYLSRTVGAFKFMSEGYVPPEPKTPGAKKKGKGGGVPIVPIAIGVGSIVAIVVIVVLLKFLNIV